MTNDQLARGVANSLWPYLRAGRWRRHTCLRDLGKWNPAGYPSGPRTASVPSTPAASTVVVVHEEEWIAALLLAEEWPGAECAMCGGAGHVALTETSSGMGAWYERTDMPCPACAGAGILRSSWAIRLTRESHDATLAGLTGTQRVAYLGSLYSVVRTPFRPQPNRHGRLRLRRVEYDPRLCPVAAGALTTLARAASLVRVDEDRVDEYLVDNRAW